MYEYRALATYTWHCSHCLLHPLDFMSLHFVVNIGSFLMYFYSPYDPTLPHTVTLPLWLHLPVLVT